MLDQLLTDSVERGPDHEAVRFGGEALTYGELEDLVGKVAASLQRAGVRRGDRVGIYVNKSLASIISVFGILRAGGVYVPLDPLAPARRLAFITRNCGIRVLLTAPDKVANLPRIASEGSPLEVAVFMQATAETAIDLPAEIHCITWDEVSAGQGQGSAPPTAIESDLAYILYTSGSTGDPKGVMISHRTSLTFVNWAQGRFGVQSRDRVSNHAPLHFDLSIFDIFATVKGGGTVLPIAEPLSAFPRQLAQFLADERVTIFYGVPSTLTRMVLHGDLERLSFAALRTILFAGEVFPIKYLRRLRELIPQAEYFNLYGPTETNVCTYYHVESIAPDRVEPVPIGIACANTEVFALNDDRQVVKPGEIGELYARGPGLMQGYWGLPDRTKENLVRNPINHLWEERAYRTGDLVRLDSDGNYIFVGRRDNQIKSRGYRIELGEIEAALFTHPDVDEAVALAIPDDEIGNAIHAVVVTRGGREVSEGTLEGHCRDRLPKYMVPSRVEFRDSLPRTSTGKIDRLALQGQLEASTEERRIDRD